MAFFESTPLTDQQEALVEALDAAAIDLIEDIEHHYSGPDAAAYARNQVMRELTAALVGIVRDYRKRTESRSPIVLPVLVVLPSRASAVDTGDDRA